MYRAREVRGIDKEGVGRIVLKSVGYAGRTDERTRIDWLSVSCVN